MNARTSSHSSTSGSGGTSSRSRFRRTDSAACASRSISPTCACRVARRASATARPGDGASHAFQRHAGSVRADSPRLLAGLLGNVGMRGEGYDYVGPSDKRFGIFPGSGMFKKGPRWLVAAELVETNRLYARTAAHCPGVDRTTRPAPGEAHALASAVESAVFARRGRQRVTLRGLTIIPAPPRALSRRSTFRWRARRLFSTHWSMANTSRRRIMAIGRPTRSWRTIAGSSMNSRPSSTRAAAQTC